MTTNSRQEYNIPNFLRRWTWLGLVYYCFSFGNDAQAQVANHPIDVDTAFALTVPEASAPLAPGKRVTDFSTYDKTLHAKLKALLQEQNLLTLCRQERLGIAVADICDPEQPRYAGVNDHVMMYAASLPKIAILLTAFELMEKGKMEKSQANLDMLTAMIRHSSNVEASRAIAKVGFANIRRTMLDAKYQFYLPREGGLWVGKAYSKSAAWRRDPIKNLAHAATAHAAARFYYLLERGELVSPQACLEMKEILSKPALHHKFVKGLDSQPGNNAEMFRKSGTWRVYHSDSALIKHNGHTYIAVALTESSRGEQILQNLIVGIDQMIRELHAITSN
ncbi:MAG: class A beta-lactamase-related serine hydrolase [candidate division KSB1 bacterium]|nr:class A beta-lactamase-related serine hydrolase [candidate division KSB1 bacterium]